MDTRLSQVTRTLTVRLTEEEYQYLVSQSRENNIPMTTLIRVLIQEQRRRTSVRHQIATK